MNPWLVVRVDSQPGQRRREARHQAIGRERRVVGRRAAHARDVGAAQRGVAGTEGALQLCVEDLGQPVVRGGAERLGLGVQGFQVQPLGGRAEGAVGGEPQLGRSGMLALDDLPVQVAQLLGDRRVAG